MVEGNEEILLLIFNKMVILYSINSIFEGRMFCNVNVYLEV